MMTMFVKQFFNTSYRRMYSTKTCNSDRMNPNEIRKLFSKSLSDMYKAEIPQYTHLQEIVNQVNIDTLKQANKLSLMTSHDFEKLNETRHGAIRLGTPEELYNMRRLFSVMDMHPVSYYDLSQSGVPVHSTAFRPIDGNAISECPFRVFTTLLRLDLIDNKDIRDRAGSILNKRKIMSDQLLEIISRNESQGGLTKPDALSFIQEAMKVFRFNKEITVSLDVYNDLMKTHAILPDVVCFKTPHLNHLTPYTYNIDEVQDKIVSEMNNAGECSSKAVIEGPPRRDVPILLRQTSFNAVTEDVKASLEKPPTQFKHAARFGEVEQRGVALTPKGRQLYDYLLDKTRGSFAGVPNDSNSKLYMENLSSNFSCFPDDLNSLRKEKLAYFNYSVTEAGKEHLAKNVNDFNFDNYINSGFISYEGVVYEDFLPVSAAGIFQSNARVAKSADDGLQSSSSKNDFENALGCSLIDENKLYADLEKKSIQECTFFFIR